MVDDCDLPLVAQIAGAQVHDWQLLIALAESVPALKGLSGRARKRPAEPHADRAYTSRGT